MERKERLEIGKGMEGRVGYKRKVREGKGAWVKLWKRWEDRKGSRGKGKERGKGRKGNFRYGVI